MSRAFLTHPITTDSAIGGTVIERGLRFRHGRTKCILTRTSENASSTYTFSAWVKHTMLNDYRYIFSTGSAGLAFNGSSNNSNVLYIYDGSSLTNSTPFLRDTNSWYHIVMKMNSGTVYTYINGAVAHNGIGGFSLNTGGNSTRVGDYSTDHEFEGYLADVHLVDGQALDPTAFAYTEDQTGIWRPKRYTGTYGTSGFHLEFKDNSSTAAFGKDTSGNGNDFTTSGFILGDNVPDSPTNNFALCSMSNAMTGIRDGGLKFESFNDSSGSQIAVQADRILPNTGTWYWEVRWTGGSYTRYWGITRRLNNYTGVYYDNTGGVYYDMYSGKGYRLTGGSNTEVFSGGFTAYNDGTTRILGMTVDMDQMTAKYYNNNSLVCSISIPELPDDGKGDYVFSWVSTNGGSSNSLNDRFNFGQDSGFQGSNTNQYKSDANGIGDFYYTPPDGALALCSQNIPPNLTSTSIVRPQKHFDTVMWVGNGTSKRISGLEFDPDLVWIKSRSTTRNHNLFDTMRVFGDGTKERMYPNLTNAGESSTYQSKTNLTDFHHNGFSVGSGTDTNTNSHDYVAWCWKGGSPEFPTSGSVNFDGANGTNLRIANSADIQLGSTSNWTIEFWIKRTAAYVDYDVIIGKGASGTYEWFIEGFADGSVKFLYTTDGNTTWAGTHTIISSQDINRWYHVAVVRNGSGANNFKTYVNGTQTFQTTAFDIYAGTYGLDIGGYGGASAQDPPVVISNLRIVKGTSVYTSNFTPPTSPLTNITNTKLLCCQSSTSATAATVTPNSITVNGSCTPQSINPFDAFSKDGVGYSSTSDAGITNGTQPLTGASINTKAGFSIVEYNGHSNGSTTFGHGLSRAPDLFFNKSRDNSENWRVYYTIADGSYDFMYLNTNGAVNHSGYALPTSTVANKADDVNERMISYCWHSVPGYSKFGFYLGNGQASNGSFVDCGFEPAVVIFKRHNSTDNWGIFDNKRVDSNPSNPKKRFLYPDLNAAEWQGGTNDHMDFYSTGFRVQNTGSMIGASGGQFIYMAFASKPDDSVYDVVTTAR